MSSKNNKLVLKNSSLCEDDETSIFTVRSIKNNEIINDGEVIELINKNGIVIFSNNEIPKSSESNFFPSIQPVKTGYFQVQILLWSEDAWNTQEKEKKNKIIIKKVIRTVKPDALQEKSIVESKPLKLPTEKTELLKPKTVGVDSKVKKIVRAVKPSVVKETENVPKFTGIQIKPTVKKNNKSTT